MPARSPANRVKLALAEEGSLAEIEYDSVSKIYDDGTQAVHDLDLRSGINLGFGGAHGPESCQTVGLVDWAIARVAPGRVA